MKLRSEKAVGKDVQGKICRVEVSITTPTESAHSLEG